MQPDTTLLPESALTAVAGNKLHWGKIYGCAPALLLAEIGATRPGPRVVLVPTVAEAESLESQIGFFAADANGVVLFPDPETLPYDCFSPHQDLISRRLSVLRRLAKREIHTLLVAVPTLFYRLPPTAYMHACSVTLTTGQRLRLEDLNSQLSDAGYARVGQVSEHGEFAVRGSLMNVFPMGTEAPVRLEVESIFPVPRSPC